STGVILSALSIANQCEINYRTSKNHRLQVELALLKMCHLGSAIQLSRQGDVPAESAEKKKPTHDPKPVAKDTVKEPAVAPTPPKKDQQAILGQAATAPVPPPAVSPAVAEKKA